MTDTITTYSLLCFLKFWNQDSDSNNLTEFLFFSILFTDFPNSIILQWFYILATKSSKKFIRLWSFFRAKTHTIFCVRGMKKGQKYNSKNTQKKESQEHGQEVIQYHQKERAKHVYVLSTLCASKLLFGHSLSSTDDFFYYFLGVGQHTAQGSQQLSDKIRKWKVIIKRDVFERKYKKLIGFNDQLDVKVREGRILGCLKDGKLSRLLVQSSEMKKTGIGNSDGEIMTSSWDACGYLSKATQQAAGYQAVLSNTLETSHKWLLKFK